MRIVVFLGVCGSVIMSVFVIRKKTKWWKIEKQHRRLIYAFESKDIYLYWVVNVKTWILKLEETPNFFFLLLSFLSLMFQFLDKPILFMNVVFL
jgi:hypothetical protein